ncbi:MAG: TolB family protein [bacterium]
MLFKNCRVGDLTISPKTHELWGIRHSASKSTLLYSAYPYRTLVPLVEFEPGDVLQGLSISPSGRFLAATLHQASGRQAMVVADVALLIKRKKFTYRVIHEEGSPEFPAWSPDESFLYWNAYINGVSNIYRYHFKTSKVQAMSHVLRGLFRPVYLNAKYLFAFEFSSDGFIPVIIPNQPATRLPAIHYFGQKVVNENPQVTAWTLKSVTETNHNNSNSAREKHYSGISELELHAFIPVVTGFQDQKVLGLFAHVADPLFTHDFIFEAGLSPFSNNPAAPKVHFKGKYEYNKKYRLEVEHNAPNFYDLFNHRKASLIGTKVTVGNTYYWKYDNPHKIKHTSELDLYTGIEAINDNLISVANPDFMVFETSLNSRNIRRAIGSVDSELGYEWTLTLMGLGVKDRKPQVVAGFHIEWDRFLTWNWPHNVIHLKLATGYINNQADLAIGKFYFGGFGNRYFENKAVKQFRDVFRFPGIPIYSLDALSFAKVLFEYNLPPLRFGGAKIGQHQLSHIDTSWFLQGLLVDSHQKNKWINLGGQINLVFIHWFNLESTLSAGVAQAWHENGHFFAWFISFKILRN